MLLQVMSEEKNSGFQTQSSGDGLKRITNLGRDPWTVKEFSGVVRFAASRRVQPLDFNGYAVGKSFRTTELKLEPKTLYYLITRD
jgi:hypothetical protein